MTDRVYELTNRRQFKAFLMDNDYFIVKACATWCRPCVQSTPFFMKVFNENIPKVIKLIKLDVDDGDDLASYLRIKSMPTYIHYFKGEPKEICNSSNQKDIIAFFEKVIGYYQ